MSTRIEIKVPDIGEFSDIPVIEVLVATGDTVSAEDSLVTLESDKATMEVPSPQAGVIVEMKLKVDDSVSEGDVVAILESATENNDPDPLVEADPAANFSDSSNDVSKPVEGLESGSEKQTAEAGALVEEATVETESAGQDEDIPDTDLPPGQGVVRGFEAIDPSAVPYASPAVRKFAREHGANLVAVKGSGKGGRILRDDVTAFIKSVMTRPATSPGSSTGLGLPPAPAVDFSRFGPVKEQALTRIQKLAGAHLHRNWVGIPHVTQHDQADITDMEVFRKANASDALAQGFKLTPLVFLIKASVAAMKKFPQFNASLDSTGENLIIKSYYNIGIAVDTPEGLIVPVLRDCDRKGIMELAAELVEISARARDKKLKPQDIQGGCFTISSLGGIGGTAFTPIINAPEVAILGVSRSRMQPVWDGSAFQPRLMLPLSVSYDHRVIDGAAAARFTRYLASRLEDLRRPTL